MSDPDISNDSYARAERSAQREKPEPVAPWKPHYLSTLQYYALNRACIPVWQAFNSADIGGVYLVGSCTTRPDWRDVDVRAIIDDAAFDRMFPKMVGQGLLTDENAMWSLFCAAVAAWLSQQTGLPVDFQVQRQSAANARYSIKGGHMRNAIGIHEPCFAAGGDATFTVEDREPEPA